MVRKKALEQTVYDFVNEKIKAKAWQPKQHIKEMDVAQALNISRTPIRSAFKRLEEDGVLKIVPYKGALILEPEIDSDGFQDRIQFLEVLISYHFQTVELNEIDYDTSLLEEDYLELTELRYSECDFEEKEIDLWYNLLFYCDNDYMKGLILDTVRYLAPKKGRLQAIIKSSRDKKLNHYEQLIAYLAENNYPYARRELRILLNQLNMNVIQGV